MDKPLPTKTNLEANPIDWIIWIYFNEMFKFIVLFTLIDNYKYIE